MNSSLGLRVEYARFGRFAGEIGTGLPGDRPGELRRTAALLSASRGESCAAPDAPEPARNVAPFRGSIMRDSVAATVSLVYLARLREAFGAASERIEAPPEVNTVGALARLAGERGRAWAVELAPESRGAHRRQPRPRLIRHADPRRATRSRIFPPVTGG